MKQSSDKTAESIPSQDLSTRRFVILGWGILGLFFAGVVVFFGGAVYSTAAEYRLIAGTVQTTATIHSNEIQSESYSRKGKYRTRHFLTAAYSYTFSGQSYSGTAVFPAGQRNGSASAAGRAKAAVATLTTAYVSPADPSRSFLLPWRDPTPIVVGSIASLMFAVGALVAGGLHIVGNRMPTRRHPGQYTLAIFRSPITRRNTLAFITLPLTVGLALPAHFYVTEHATQTVPTEVTVFAAVLAGLWLASAAALAYFALSARALPAASIAIASKSVRLGLPTPLTITLLPHAHAAGQAHLRVRCIRTTTKVHAKGHSTYPETIAEIPIDLGEVTPAFHQRAVTFAPTLEIPSHLPPSNASARSSVTYLARLTLVRPGAVDAAIDFHLPVTA